MKYILSLIFVLCFPLGVSAQLEVFLSSSGLEYSENIWTSQSYPYPNSDEIFIEHHYAREDIPSEYVLNDEDFRDRIFEILSGSDEAKQERYASFLNFDKYNMQKYISAALNENIDNDIVNKSATFELTPYESTFQSCGLDLGARESIVVDLIERIHIERINNGYFTKIENIEYSDITFGDCIIPFPDKERTNALDKSFFSNQLIFDSEAGNPLRFSDDLEQSASILSASATASDELQETLKMNSQRIETSSGFIKEHGRNRILYVHQNHYVNPYVDSHINDMGGSYEVNNAAYNTSHVLYISESDDESERMIQNWTEIQPGIFRKILLQENSYDTIAGVLTPSQNVGATSYYAILYNYDTTPPICSEAVFSHDAGGMQRFVLPENSWAYDRKYVSFLCSDIESGCHCDVSDLSCYERDGNIYSTPIAIPHSGDVSYSFTNTAGESSVPCSLYTTEFIRYDFINPDVRIFLSGSLISPEKEYISNNGVLYDGVQISEKNYYNISDDFTFVADENRDISFEVFEPEISDSSQEFSSLKSFEIDVHVKQGLSWNTLGSYTPPYSITANSYSIDIDEINAKITSRDILTRSGEYALVFHIEDNAGNKTRATWQYSIIPGDINTGNSTITTPVRNTQYANNSDTYNYILTLRDGYANPIAFREVSSISHDCGVNPHCKYIRTDMSGSSPAGNEALGLTLSNTISDDNGQILFSVNALAPGDFTESFKLEFIYPSETIVFEGEENIFLKPLVGVFETQDTTDGWVSDRILLNQSAGYRVRVDDINSEGYSWTLNDFSSEFSTRYTDGTTEFTLESPLSAGSFSGTFSSTLGADEGHKEILEIGSSGISGVIVSYDLGGENIRYKLSRHTHGDGILYLTNNDIENNPVKILGLFQATGNSHNLDERQNMSDIDSSIERASFRRNVSKHISALNSGDEYGGVKFIDKTFDSDKNYILEADPGFQTLVVKNGNILINQDFNLSEKNIGIISYKEDAYSTQNGYNDVGNIYISDTVTRVNAFIYADGAIISTDDSANPYSSDIITRDNNLGKQLTIQGSIFTRNTLAGSREISGEYMLPGGSLTTNRNLAVQYDLYELRTGNNGCSQDAHGFCDIPHYLIIQYDTRIQSNPPTLFSG